MASFKLESLGGSWAQQKPAVAAQRIRLDIFMVGDNHQLYHYWQGQGEPFRLESLGGSFRGGVTAFSWDIHHRDVFAIGSDNQLYHYWQGPSEARFNHEVLGGNWDGPVKAVSWGPGRWDVFAVGTNFELYHFWYPRYEPTGPTFGLESLGGNHTTTWTLASIAWPGRLDVFAHGDNWGLLHYFQRAGEPFAVEKVPGRPGPGYHLDAVSWGPGRLDVFRCATRLSVTELQHFWQNPGSGAWGSEEVGSYYGNPEPLAAATWGLPRLDLFAIESPGSGATVDEAVHHHWQHDSPFRSESLGGSWRGSLSAASWGPGRLDVFAVGNNRQLYHYWQG